MTEKFDELAIAFPVFGQLRNCVDLAVVAALISKRDLLGAADCRLDILLDRARLRGPQLEVPRSVDSRVSFVRSGKGWIVSVSGGVEIDPWSVLENVEQSESLDAPYHKALQRMPERWWW